MASAAPPIRYPNVYGIDMPVCSELIAHNRSVEEICEEIGADWLVFQDLSDLIESVQVGNPALNGLEYSCFTGEYMTEGITQTYLTQIEELRNDDAKTKEPNESVHIV